MQPLPVRVETGRVEMSSAATSARSRLLTGMECDPEALS
jgi:hypothetical protein